MPPKTQKKTVNLRRRQRRYRKSAAPTRGLTGQGTDFASCRDTLGNVDIQPNQVYTLQNVALTNSARAKAIAQGFQFYRISMVEVRWKASIDTYVGSSTVPHVYYMVDKSNTFPVGTDLQTLKQAGAKPRRLDDKMVVCRFKPAVHLVSDDSAGGPAPVTETAGVLRVSPWITTNANAGEPSAWAPNSVDHRGLIFAVEQVIPGNIAVGQAEVILHFQFKKALWQPASTEPNVNVIDLDTMTIIPPTPKEQPLLA